MKAYSDNGEKYGYYSYDDAGQRMYKVTLNNTLSRINALGDNVLEVEKLMLYPNGYININQNGEYTKHYYADDIRVASKIGTGFLYESGDNSCDIVTDSNYLDERKEAQYDIMLEELENVTIPKDTIMQIDYSYDPFIFCELWRENFYADDPENELYFYYGNHLSSTQVITDIDGNVAQAILYMPFGEVISEYNSYWHNGLVPDYMFNGKELDEESNLYYFGARYYSPPTFISRDPLFEQKHWLNPYHYCSNNPVNRVDPTGLSDSRIDGWIDDGNGNVFWDNNTNSQAEFNTNYANHSGYSYASDPDNPNSYTLPNGEGQLVMNKWMASENINRGGGVLLDISFIPTNSSAEVGWTQTFSSNLPPLNEGNLWTAMPQTNIGTEYLDGGPMGGSTDPSLAGYFDKKPNARLWDPPTMAKHYEAQYDVFFNAQSTVLVNGQRTVSLGWGFTVNSDTRQTISVPTILKNTTSFHNTAVQSLSNRISGR